MAAGAGPFARSPLLLVTAVVLAVGAAARLPPLLSWSAPLPRPDRAAATTGWAELRSLEPANGPEPAAPPPTPPEPPPAAAAERTVPLPTATRPVPSDPLTATALQELADELGRHQAALAEREHRVALREAVLAAVAERIDQQLTRLEAVKGELERLNGAVSAENRAKIAQMVKVYEAMKAKSAAAVFEPMPLELLLPIVRGMRETKVAAIVAEMDPAKARALTAELLRGAAPQP